MNTTAQVLDEPMNRMAVDGLPPSRRAPIIPAEAPAPASTKRPAPSYRKPLLLAMAGLALAVGGYRWWDYARTWETTDNAVITGSAHQIAARVAGTVVEVLVHDNEAVRAGQPLVKLDDRDEQVSLTQAQGGLAQAEAQGAQAAAQTAAARAAQREAEAMLSTAQAQLAQAKASATKATADFQRAAQLLPQRALSTQDFDAARAARDAAQAAVHSAEAGIQSAQARGESTAAQLRAAQAAESVAAAARQTAQAAVEAAQLQLSYTTVTAPTDGRVGRKSVQTGNRIVPGQPLMALVEDFTWVVANFKETQLARMTPGQRVELEVDALPGRTLAGRLDSFAPGSGATFALLPPDNATGNFTKIVQRVPVKIYFDPSSVQSLNGRLSPGLSVFAKVNIRAPLASTAPAAVAAVH